MRLALFALHLTIFVILKKKKEREGLKLSSGTPLFQYLSVRVVKCSRFHRITLLTCFAQVKEDRMRSQVLELRPIFKRIIKRKNERATK